MHSHSVGSRNTRWSGEGPVREYLAFVLDAQRYLSDTFGVQEIRGYSGVTPIADAPAHIKGVANLRGLIVPIFDMHVRFGNHNPTCNEQTIVGVPGVLERAMGVVVDAVSDVVQISDRDILSLPPLGVAELIGHIVSR